MVQRTRRRGALSAALVCLILPAPAAMAQYPTVVAQIDETETQGLDPYGGLPRLRDKFPRGDGQQDPDPTPTATPTEEPTPEPTATATEEPSPTPRPTATAKPGKGDLARTGSSDPPLFALGGLALIGFGVSLRLRLALDDARRRV